MSIPPLQIVTDMRFRSYIGGTLLEAGTETTAINLQSFILCMTARPDVQRRAQMEIDEVIGILRTPYLKDLDDLPYVRALIKEVCLQNNQNTNHANSAWVFSAPPI